MELFFEFLLEFLFGAILRKAYRWIRGKKATEEIEEEKVPDALPAPDLAKRVGPTELLQKEIYDLPLAGGSVYPVPTGGSDPPPQIVSREQKGGKRIYKYRRPPADEPEFNPLTKFNSDTNAEKLVRFPIYGVEARDISNG